VPSLFVVGLVPVVSRARVLVHEVLGRDAQAAARAGARCASLVFRRGAQADACGTARYLIVVYKTLPAAMLVERRKYLIVAARPKLAAPRRYLIAVPKPLSSYFQEVKITITFRGR
jgi:hypothetical protein